MLMFDIPLRRGAMFRLINRSYYHIENSTNTFQFVGTLPEARRHQTSDGWITYFVVSGQRPGGFGMREYFLPMNAEIKLIDEGRDLP